MGIFRTLFGRPDPVVARAIDPSTAPRFSIDAASIPPEFFGLSAYDDVFAPAPRVSRRMAMQVPAVKRGRDLIAGSIGSLPLQTYRGEYAQPVRTMLLEQPEPDIPYAVTLTRTAEDMLFEGFGWWRVIERDAYGWPVKVRRLNARSVDCTRGDQKVWYRRDGTIQGESWEWIPDQELIRFDSPTDPILVAGARAIRTCLKLEALSANYADEPQAREYFTPADGADPVEDDEIERILRQWIAARQQRRTGYVPAALTLNNVPQLSSREMQLVEARQQAVLELARLMGIDPEELGVSTTSRTYANQFDRRKAFLDFTLGMYLRAIEQRLSMGDVTARGQYVLFNLDAFLRSDALSRYQAYSAGLAAGALTPEEVRALEDRPPINQQEAPVQDITQDRGSNVLELPAASQRAGARFAAGPGLVLDAPAEGGVHFKVDQAKRQITGLITPYGDARGEHAGQLFAFTKGSIRIPEDPSRVKMLVNHDPSSAIGFMVSYDDRDDALYGTFQLDGSPEADRALQKASDRVWDGLSAGFVPGSKFRLKDGVQFAVDAPMYETSLCPSPAFADARVQSVALAADTEGIITMTETTVAPAADQQATPSADGKSVEQQVTETLAQFGIKPGDSLSFNQVTKAIEDGFAHLQAAAGGPTQVAAVPGNGQVAGAQFQVNEELPYRFNAPTRGEHGFVEDLRDMQHGNAVAKQRLDKFLEHMGPAFAVTRTNVAAFNPVQNRPELYVPNLDYQRPLWDSVSTGTLDNITAFTIPKFASASGLVGPHTEGVEPTPGAFSASVQTVTPTAISGKVEIDREVLDQGGSPQTDTIVWQEMQRAYWESIEQDIATTLDALAANTLYTGAEINFSGAVDGALDDEFTDLFTGLQFVRGGNRYTAFVSDGQLYAAITGAKDTTGRSLYPLLGPTNADGTVQPTLSAANVKGQTIRPAWALGSAVSSNSYLFVPSSVWAWASAPRRFSFEYQVKSVDMAIWGYTGSAVLRNTDVARIDYTTADV